MRGFVIQLENKILLTFFRFTVFLRLQFRRILPDEPFDNQISDHSDNKESGNNPKLGVDAYPVSVNISDDKSETLPESVIGKCGSRFVGENNSVQC